MSDISAGNVSVYRNLQHNSSSILFSAQKVEILHLMTKKIVLGKDGKNKLDIKWKKPWNALIENGSIEKNWRARQDSNLRPSDS